VAALGYAGWGEGQLDGELARHGWFNVKGDDPLLYEAPAGERWERGFGSAGINPRLLANATGNA
jgi:putative transcriptional regulator